MKKRFAELSKGAQEKAELEYHRMKPEELDRTMSRATKTGLHRPTGKRKNRVAEKKRAA